MLGEQELDKRIEDILIELSVPRSYTCFNYMAQAIKDEYKALNNPQKTKRKVYNEIAKELNVADSTVVFHLQTAVGCMYLHKDHNGVLKYFGEGSTFQYQRPKMLRVIKGIARYIIKEEKGEI